jgi:ubiquinone/menaquinone biosynthesis C-methylase UbiE
MPKDPYRKFVPIYDLVIGSTNSIIKRIRLNLAPPIPGMKVLDVGCGTGADLKPYGEAGCEMYGIDLSPSMLGRARNKFGRSADLRLGDAAHMPFQDRFFDLVLSSYTLHEMPNNRRSSVINEMVRVVKNDGSLLLTDFHTGSIRFPDGWIGKAFITFLEILGGREHLLNGRDFLASGGLQGLIEPFRFNVDKKKIFGGGNIALFLLSVASNRKNGGQVLRRGQVSV